MAIFFLRIPRFLHDFAKEIFRNSRRNSHNSSFGWFLHKQPIKLIKKQRKNYWRNPQIYSKPSNERTQLLDSSVWAPDAPSKILRNQIFQWRISWVSAHNLSLISAYSQKGENCVFFSNSHQAMSSFYYRKNSLKILITSCDFLRGRP